MKTKASDEEGKKGRGDGKKKDIPITE